MELGLGFVILCLAIGCLYWIEKDNKKFIK